MVTEGAADLIGIDGNNGREGCGNRVAWPNLGSFELVHIRHEEGRDVPGRDRGAEWGAILASVDCDF
jgi:hypothetical protein